MSIASEISRLQTAKADLKTAIELKGVSVVPTAKLDEYADLVESIEGKITIEDGVSFAYSTFSKLPDWIQNADWSEKADLNNCFSTCTLNSISLPELPKVTGMKSCFNYCYFLTSISLPELPKVTNMSSCFSFCFSLTSISLPELPNVVNMNSCFSSCSSLTSISLPELPKITNMSSCFRDCTSLQDLTIGSINSSISTLSNWYISGCTLLTVSSLLNILNALPSTTNSKTCTLGTTNINKLSDEQKAIATNKGWILN